MHEEQGSITPFIGLFMVAVLGAIWLLALATADVTQGARAQTAADAAALAGANQDRTAANTAARANGGELLAMHDNITPSAVAAVAASGALQAADVPVSAAVTDVTVTVRVGHHVARARARASRLEVAAAGSRPVP